MLGRFAIDADAVRGTITRWLVASGARVAEAQPIAEVRQTEASSFAAASIFLAPVSGKVEVSADGATGTLAFCKHEALLSGKLCTVCGVDVGSLSKKALRFLHDAAGGGDGTRADAGGDERGAAASSSSVLPGMRSYRLRGGMEVSMADAYAKRADSAIMVRLPLARSVRHLRLLQVHSWALF